MRSDLWRAYTRGSRHISQPHVKLLGTEDTSHQCDHQVTGCFTDNDPAASVCKSAYFLPIPHEACGGSGAKLLNSSC